MKILILGSGAREHALAETLARSPGRPELFCLGTYRNPGIEMICGRPVVIGDITGGSTVVGVARQRGIDLAVIGPEAPLETGVVDALEEAGVSVVGPRRIPAQIETSKTFCRNLLREVSPRAVPAFFVVETIAQAEAALAELGDAYVVKADGLRGGKGVKVAGDHLSSHEDALAYCREVLSESSTLVIEEKLIGQEFSLLSFTDGYECLHMPPAQDHKRAWEGDRGPNTGGMGSYTDVNASLPFLGRQDVVTAQRLNERVVRGIRETTGVPYRGILYGGFMAGVDGVAVVEYNARFGDPEALNILPLLETDLVEIFSAIVSNGIAAMDVRFRSAATVCKYLVPPGYPEKGEKGLPLSLAAQDAHLAVTGDTRIYIGSLEPAPDPDQDSGVTAGAVAQAGTITQAATDAQADTITQAAVDAQPGTTPPPRWRLLTAGSRALAVTGLGSSLAAAERNAESMIRTLDTGLIHRRDIGTDELVHRRVEQMNALRNRPLRVGILGSTRGTSAQKLIDAAEAFTVPASVEVVISDREDAYILTRAARHGIPFHYVNPRTEEGEKKSRPLLDTEITSLLGAYGVDLVLCVGYMRILSSVFCDRYRDRALNVHPSLLPEFAGGMDKSVHEEVIRAGRTETGCTVHYVTAAVDSGPILLQKKCPVRPEDTPDTLKERVQELEGDALVEAIGLHRSKWG